MTLLPRARGAGATLIVRLLVPLLAVLALVALALVPLGCQQKNAPATVSVEGGILLGADEAGCRLRALGPLVTCRFAWPSGAGSQSYQVEIGNVLDAEHATITVAAGDRRAQARAGTIRGSSISLAVDRVGGQVTEIAISSPDPPLPFTFAVLGDSQGHDDALAAALEKLATTKARFLIHLGDMVPAGEERQYRHFLETMGKWTKPYFTVAGNHDVRGGGAVIYERELAPLRYSFTYGGYAFVFLDSSQLQLNEEQLAWLRSGRQEKILVFTHAPPFDPLAPAGSGHTLGAAGAKEFTEAVSAAGVKGVFSGHIHLFSRRQVGDTLYVISGGGGAALYAGQEEGGFHHFVLVTVEEHGIRAEAVPFPAPAEKAEVAIRGPDGVVVLTVADLKSLSGRVRDSCFQNQFGNFGGRGKYRGIPVADLVALVGGMRAGDRLVVHSEDGFRQEFAYENVVPPPGWQCQGEMILAYAFVPIGNQVVSGQKVTGQETSSQVTGGPEEMTVPEWADGPRLAFLPADEEYCNDDCAATSAPGMGWHTYESAGARWVRNVTLIEVVRNGVSR